MLGSGARQSERHEMRAGCAGHVPFPDCLAAKTQAARRGGQPEALGVLPFPVLHRWLSLSARGSPAVAARAAGEGLAVAAHPGRRGRAPPGGAATGGGAARGHTVKSKSHPL